MYLRTEKWTKRLDFFFLSAWLMISLGVALISLLWLGVDFRGYYAAAQVLLAGSNPYDYHVLHHYQYFTKGLRSGDFSRFLAERLKS